MATIKENSGGCESSLASIPSPSPNPSHATSSSALSSDETPIADQLLQCRKEFKRHSFNHQAAQTHLRFLESCLSHQITPKGLRLHKRCVALAASQTDINSQFTNIIQKAEHDLVDALRNHYRQVNAKSITSLQRNKVERFSLTSNAAGDVLLHHQTTLKATAKNISKKISVRQATTNNKLDRLYL